MDTNHTGKAPVKTGRKTKYSPALINKLISYIESGLNLKQSCQAALIGETTLREWRKLYPDFNERIEAAREILRAKILAKIRDAGKNDWKAHAEFLRLAFPEYRYGNGPSVNVAVQQTLAVSDPERAKLIEQLEASRAPALANTSCVEAPLQLADAGDSQEKALAAERQLKEERTVEVRVEPVREQPPKTVVERADLLEERRQWRAAWRRDEVDELLGD